MVRRLMADVTTMWDDILGHVRLSHPDLIRGWFRDLEPGEVNGGVLQVRARNAAQSRYLQTHCRLAFVEAAQAATGRLVSVQFMPDCDDVPEENAELFGGPDEQIKLNEEYVFENFVTGPCNRLAHAAASAVVDDPGRSYNPLFIYGPVGLGKTHLLQAICHAVGERQADCRFHYISCETFVNQFIACVERGALNQFRYRYRHVGILVIDDIQFLAERERSQEEFFHTFNTLYQSQRQIILSADCSPEEIPSLEERLVSRFSSGLVALLDRPCKETRMAILRNKAKLKCIEVPEDVIHYVAGKFENSIRELEGILIRLDALSQTLGKPITLDLSREALGEQAEKPIPITAIVEVVSKRFSVKIADLLGKKRSKSITHPRHVSMYLARQLTSQSLEEIGGYFGGRDHTTVLHANRMISRAAEDDPKVATMLEDIGREVRNVV